MTTDEFIKKAIGIKWVDRSCNFKEMDCWGLVILYYLHVLNIRLPKINGYQSKTGTIQSQALQEADTHWIRLKKPENHCVFLAYIGNYPCHVGIIIDNHVIHAKGNIKEGGQVQYNTLYAIEKCYTNVEYYKYASLFS